MEMLTFSAPAVNPETRPFWDACNDGKLLVGRCTTCRKHHYYPRPFCPHCGGDKVEWVEAEGTGQVYSYTVMRRFEPVRVLCMVELAEGVRMMTVLRTAEPDAVRIGLPVSLAFAESAGGQKLPVFEPAG
jgi:uncharacterized OB-fold protein